MKMTGRYNPHTVGFVLLCVFAFVLPTMESPKTIALALVFIAWLSTLFLGATLPRRLDAFEWSLLGLIGASLASTVANWPFDNGIKGLKDTLYWTLLGWYLYRADYSLEKKYRVVLFVVAGVLVGLLWGGIDVARHKNVLLEFNSVGVVTHSSIYLGVVFVTTFAIVYFGTGTGKQSSVSTQAFLWVTVLAMFVGLMLMASRGAILAVGVLSAFLIIILRDKRLWLGLAALPGIAFIAMVLLPNTFGQHRFISKIEDVLTQRSLAGNDEVRRENWRIAVAQIQQGESIIFGVGPRNYSSIDVRKLGLESLSYGAKLHHAHNVFLTKYIEEGLLGLLALLFFIGVVARRLGADWQARAWRNWLWVAGLAAIFVPIVAGSFNTPWYQEHALLASLFIGMYMSTRRRKAPS